MESEFRVNDDHRRNELSIIPGGGVVTVVHTNGKRFVYDKIKNIRAYCERIGADEKVSEIWVENQCVFKR